MKPVRVMGPRDALFSLLALVYSLPAWAYPFGNDQALHWYLGYRWLHGELPFESGISSKPIGIFVVHMLSTALFGVEQWPIRVTEALSVIGIGYLLALAALPRSAPRFDGLFGMGALLFAGAYYTYFDYWDTAHPELWEAGCLVAAFVVSVHAKSRVARDVGAGALSGAAFMFKFPAALPALVVAGSCGLAAWRESAGGLDLVGSVLRAALRFLLGAALVFALCTAPYLVSGKLDVMWEILHDFILHYAEQAPTQRGLPAWLHLERGGSLVLSALALWLSAVAVSVYRRDWASLERLGLLLLIGGLAAGSVVVQGRYFGYHWVVLSPFLAALLMAGLVALLPLEKWPSLGGMAALTLMAFSLLVCEPRWERPKEHSYLAHAKSVRAYRSGQQTREQYVRAFLGRSRLDATLGMERIARHIHAAKRPGDTLCARGFATPLYPLTLLRCTSRHIVQEIVPAGLPSWPAEYARALREHPPTFILTFTDRKRDLLALERQGYHRIATEGKLALMSLRPPTLPSGPAPAGATPP